MQRYKLSIDDANAVKRTVPHVLIEAPSRIYVGPTLKRSLQDLLDSDRDFQLDMLNTTDTMHQVRKRKKYVIDLTKDENADIESLN